MKTMKKVLCSLLVVVMCLTSAPLDGFVGIDWPEFNIGEWFGSKASALAPEGQCGDNVYWSYDSTTDELVISGSGDMYDYENYDSPFCLGFFKSAVINSGVTSIGDSAFRGCTELINITIPNSITSIGYCAFAGCSSLANVIITNSNITSIGDYAFDSCIALPSITIPNSVTSIGESAFIGCTSLTSIKIPDSVTSIGTEAFGYCDRLTNIEVDKNNPYYCDYNGVLFNKNISKLIIYPAGKTETLYTIPNSVATIDDYAFCGCYNLKNVIIPDSVTWIGLSLSLIITLTNIEVDEKNPYYCDIDGVLFNKDKTELIRYPAGNTESSYTIPNGATSIGMFAFGNCSNLKSIIFPDSVTHIGSGAFELCLALTSIVIPNNVVTIDFGAFMFCVSLTNITLPKSVTNIGDYAFDFCGNLTDVYYGDGEEQWKKISIGTDNEQLTNATIHYNSTGPSDNPNNGDNSNKVSINFTSDTYEVEVDDTVTVSATVTCPVGVDNSNLDMVWEVIDPDGTEIVSEGEYSRSETEWACYAEIKGLNEGTYYINLRDNNSTVFDTVKIIVSDNNIFDQPGAGGDIVSDKTIYPIKAKISGNATNLIYDNDWWKWNTKKFQVSGTIDNVLSQYDTWNAAKEYEKKKYYNSIGVNQLENLYITLKSPDAKKIYFKGGKSEITFPLGRTIGAGSSDTFECDVYVDRDYYPPQGSEVITLECILNGTITDVTIGGKEISGVYSTFDIRITNKSYEWEKQSLKELITELKSMVRPYEDYYRSNVGRLYGGTGLFEDMTAVEVAYSAGAMASSLELADTCFDIIYYFTNMNFTLGDVVKEYGKAFMDLLSEDSNNKVSEIIGAMESRLLHNEYFDGFIEWCRASYGVDAGAYAKYSNHCPTDVIVTGEDGRTVLEIINDEILVCDENILANVFESRKTFYLPTGIDYEIKITATDDGTMDYFVETATENGERRIIKYSDVPLVKGKSYTAIAPSYISEDTSVYNLKSEDGTIIKHGCLKHSTIIISSGKAPTCTLSGYAQLLKCTLCGETIKIGEIAATGHQLEEPLFTEIPATCVSQGVGIFECSKCDYVETKIIPATGHSFTEGQSKCNNCDYDKADDCECDCHASGIKAFFFKIKLFFWKLFKKNPLCECGAAHY